MSTSTAVPAGSLGSSDSTTPAVGGARHADEVNDPQIARRTAEYRAAAAEAELDRARADRERAEAARDQAAGNGGVNIAVQAVKIVLGLAVMIGGLLYIKHVTMPEADMAYVAVMLLFLVVMMIGGGLLTHGVQTIITAARAGGK